MLILRIFFEKRVKKKNKKFLKIFQKTLDTFFII